MLQKNKTNEHARRCVRCHGTGRVPCEICQGRGQVYLGQSSRSANQFARCQACSGLKTARCRNCGGSGYVHS